MFLKNFKQHKIAQSFKTILFSLFVFYGTNNFAMLRIKDVLDPRFNIQFAPRWQLYSPPKASEAFAPYTQWSYGYAQWKDIQLHVGCESKVDAKYTDDLPVTVELFGNFRFFPNKYFQHEPKNQIFGLVPKLVVARSESVEWFVGGGLSYVGAYRKNSNAVNEKTPQKTNFNSITSSLLYILGLDDSDSKASFEFIGGVATAGFNKHIDDRWHFTASIKFIAPIFTDKNNYLFLTQIGLKYHFF